MLCNGAFRFHFKQAPSPARARLSKEVQKLFQKRGKQNPKKRISSDKTHYSVSQSSQPCVTIRREDVVQISVLNHHTRKYIR